MAEPVVVTIPHKLTKEEAVRRLKKGFGDVRSTVGEKFGIPAGTQGGRVFRFKQKGVPPLKGGPRGALMVTVALRIPEVVPEGDRDLWRQLAAREAFAPHEAV